MSKTIKSIRGMHDVLPEQSPAWQDFENTVRSLLNSYGYNEIRMPIVEQSPLFSRAVGGVTDIVEKEMYTFDDRNGDSLSLRPEGTASCVRAGIQHGLLHNQQQRLWYMGPMFRHERPQKGRYRQFHQIGVETFGIDGPDIDAELIAMCARLWKQLGLKNIRLELNSLGSSESRKVYREILVDYFKQHEDLLDEDSKRRLETNPLRILDSKNPALQEINNNAPSLHDHLDEDSKAHFEGLKSLLDSMGISYIINPRLVRGLDYYSKTVFEWITDDLGAQGTICAGGRYDGLVKQLGGRETTACGFAMGMERLIELISEQSGQTITNHADLYLLIPSPAALGRGLEIAESLRTELPHLRIITNCGAGKLKAQMKRADKSGAKYALILGEDELANNAISIKPMQDQEEQITLPIDKLKDYFS